MEDVYGFGFHPATDYAAVDSPDNFILPLEYHGLLSSGDNYRPFPVYSSEDLISATSVITEAVLPDQISRKYRRDRAADHREDDANFSSIKAKIVSHPLYPRLLDAYLDCQKVGAPPEIACLLDEIRRENDVCTRNVAVSTDLGADPELDEFMETYCDILVKYKSDLTRPFDEATTFLNKIETQLSNLCKDDGAVSSEDEFSEGENEAPETHITREYRELKDNLLRKFGGHISSLKQEFSKKKKKVKLPAEARQTLLEWWNLHYKWPYPTEADKISLAESTGLDQKQINNWFINQRKRHWKPSENMQLAVMGSLSGQYF